ncbi:MAG TPA: hypothetical protein VLH38_01420 [Patescibacteria group bacterium]|nr:hypothetical protein [Patescibacteria group bacterium]
MNKTLKPIRLCQETDDVDYIKFKVDSRYTMASGEIPLHSPLDREDILPPGVDCIVEAPEVFKQIEQGEQRQWFLNKAARVCGDCALQGDNCPKEAINFMGAEIAVFDGMVVRSEAEAVEAARTQEPTFVFPMGQLPNDEKAALRFIRVHNRAGTLEAAPGKAGRTVADIFIGRAMANLTDTAPSLDSSELAHLCHQLYGMITNEDVTDGVPVTLFSTLCEQVAHDAARLKAAGHVNPVDLALRHRPEIFEELGMPPAEKLEALRQTLRANPNMLNRSPPSNFEDFIAALEPKVPFTDTQRLALRRLSIMIRYRWPQDLRIEAEQQLFNELAPTLLADITAVEYLGVLGPRFAISYSPAYLDGLLAEFMPVKEITKKDLLWACEKMGQTTPREALYAFMITLDTLRQGEWPQPMKDLKPLKTAARSSNPVAAMETMQSSLKRFKEKYPNHRFLKKADFYRLCFETPGSAMNRAATFIRTCEEVAPDFADDPDLTDVGLRRIAIRHIASPKIVRSRIAEFKASVKRVRNMYSDPEGLDEESLIIIANAQPFNVEGSAKTWLFRYKTLTNRFDGIDTWILKNCLAHNVHVKERELITRLHLYNSFFRSSLNIVASRNGKDIDDSRDKRLEDKKSLGINPAQVLEEKEAAVAQLKHIFTLVQTLGPEERMAVMEAYQIDWYTKEASTMTTEELQVHFDTENLKVYVDTHIMPRLQQAVASQQQSSSACVPPNS